MKKFLSLLVAFTVPAIAQDAPATTAPAPATTSTATTPTAGKPKPLSAGDKKFMKDSMEGMYYVMAIVGKVRNSARLEPTKTLGSKLKQDLDKVWADVGGFASERGETIPNDLAGADKSKSERLGKAGEKFDKEFTKIVSKEMDKLAKTFQTAEKSAQEPQIKEIAAKWSATLKEDAELADSTAKEVSKSR